MGKNCLILLVFMGLFGCSASEDEQGGILNVPEWAVGNWEHNNGNTFIRIYTNKIKVHNDSINSVMRDTLRERYEYGEHATIYFNSNFKENQYIHLTRRHEDTLKVKYIVIDEDTEDETVLTDLIFIRQ